MEIGKELLYLSAKDVGSVMLSITECIDLLEDVYRLKSKGKVEAPEKPRMGHPETEGFLKAYPARLLGGGPIGTKWLGAKSTNPQLFSLPSITGLIILNDPDTFCPVAVMDCSQITGLRTACVSGIALRHFTQSGEKTVSVLGCGVQGRSHLLAAVQACKDIRKIYAWDPNVENLELFVVQMQDNYGITVTPSSNAETVVSNADVLLSFTPFGRADRFTMINKEWLKDGVTAISISGANHFTYEAFMSFDSYFMDDQEVYSIISKRPQPWGGAEKLRPTMLGDFLTGKAGGRRNSAEKIVLVTGGEGICDVSVGKSIADRALAQGIGTILPL